MDHVIARAASLGAAVKEFQIRRKDGAPLPDWQPGAHILLRFAAADGSAYENHYSLIGTPGQADSYRIAVQREEHGKGGSRSLHDEFGPGSEIDVSGPFNSFPLDAAGLAARPPQPRILLIAGVIGITPMVSMANALGALDMPFELHCLARSADQLVLMDELRGVAQGAIVPHVSQESGRANLAALLGPYSAGARFFVSYECRRGKCGSCYAQVLEGQPLHRDVCLTRAMRTAGMCTCVSWAAPPGRLVLEL